MSRRGIPECIDDGNDERSEFISTIGSDDLANSEHLTVSLSSEGSTGHLKWGSMRRRGGVGYLLEEDNDIDDFLRSSLL